MAGLCRGSHSRPVSPVPRVAAIHDLSGFGRTSLSVVIPILSTMGIQVCSLPTAVLSSHTGGFQNYTFLDLTDEMNGIVNHWKNLDICFDAVYSGFLGSVKQIGIVEDFIGSFSENARLITVDPVLGDDGELYQTMDSCMVKEMRSLVARADMITPNYTEAALLLGEKCKERAEQGMIKEWLHGLAEMGPGKVVLTSVPVPGRAKMSSVVAYDRDVDRIWKVDCSYIPAFYPGTGDCFASVLVGSLLQGDSLPMALDRAVQFVSMAIRATFGHACPQREGVLLERVLDNLRAPITSSIYEIWE